MKREPKQSDTIEIVFYRNLDLYPVKPWNSSYLIRRLSAGNRNRVGRYGYIQTAKQTGWMSNGYLAYLMPPKERLRVMSIAADPLIPHIDIEQFVREASRACGSRPATIAGVRQHPERPHPDYLITTECGQVANVDAVYYATIMHRYPNAKACPASDPNRPIVFRADRDVVVGLVMPLVWERNYKAIFV